MTMLSWDEIGERHPHIYGDPEVHGDKASEGDGEGVGWAAAHLVYDRPGSHDEEQDGHSGDMYFHEEKVHPKHIDYARHESDDSRVAYAREGYRTHPDRVPPLVLVHRHGVYQVADGHHRAEGAHQVDTPVRAYVAYSPHEDEPFRPDEDGRDRAPFHGAEPHPGNAVHRKEQLRFHASTVLRRQVTAAQDDDYAGCDRRYPRSPVNRVAVLRGFNNSGRLRSIASYSGPKLRIYAHVSGNSIDVLHCPFCGSGAVFARSDGTIEDSFCTAVFTVQVQPQFAAFPQTAEGMPYQWPGRPGSDQLAGGGDGAMGGFPGPIAGEQDQGAEEGGSENGNPFTDDTGGDGGSGDSDDASGSDDGKPDKAQVGGKDKPPFGKKSSFRTAAGYHLDEAEYVRHLAIQHARRRGEVARMVRDSR